MNRKKKFIEFMLDSKVLMFGDFTTKSGRKTPYFINTGNYTTGFQLLTLGEFYAEAIESNFGSEVTNLFGPAYKGIPIGTSAGSALSRLYQRDITVSFNRKEVKDHGEGGWLLGFNYAKSSKPEKVVIVEDVTTAGTSVRESIPHIIEHKNVQVIGLVISVDRKEKGRGEISALQELQEEFGIKTISLVDISDILTYLSSEVALGKIDQILLDRMYACREKFGVE